MAVSGVSSCKELPSGSRLGTASILPSPPSLRRLLTTVSTQTNDTVFALCIRCSQSQDTLISVASSVSALCHEQGLTSRLAKVDWEGLAKIGGIELGNWNGNLNSDLCSIGEHCCELHENITELELGREAHKRTVGQLEGEIELLSSQMDTLQVLGVSVSSNKVKTETFDN